MSGLRNRPPLATIHDVAQLAGVSIKTVSRVVNREPHVSAGTRARVDRAIQVLNYRPNIAARTLAGSRAYLVGLYFDNPSAGYVSQMQSGALRACRAAGYHLVIEQLAGSSVEVQNQLRQSLAAVRMDGVVLSPPVCDRGEVLDLLDALAVPHVRIAPARELGRGPYVCMDDGRAAQEMARRLLALGHRRFGFIKGHPDHAAAEIRWRGFANALAAAGLILGPRDTWQGDFSFRSGSEGARRLLSRGPRPTAIFASNDDMALGAIAMAHRLGLRIPDDLSVAGFDDSPGAEAVWPPLTTIRQPVAEMTAGAVNMLIDGHGPGRSEPQLFDFELVVRGSTGPPPIVDLAAGL